MALGVWGSGTEFLARRRFTRFEPRMNAGERRRRRDEWERAVAAALSWARREPARA
jgi:glycerol kinase